VIGTAHGTIAPFKYSFLELGFDFGTLSGTSDVGYYSLYPFAHYAFFWPFTEKLAAYAGLGGGFMINSYRFDKEGNYSDNNPAAAGIMGVNLLDMIDISYTLRTNFSGFSHKVSAGYVYRFQ